MMLKQISFATIMLLAACTPPSDRIALPQLTPTLSLRANVSSVLLRQVSLPTYAAAEEIATRSAGGLITAQPAILWADDPARAVTLALSSALGEILNTSVAPEPWPFVDLPAVAVDVRVVEFLAEADGSVNLSGQFFVGGDGIPYRNSTHEFAITETVQGTGLTAIAAAQSRALTQLAEQIARTLGR